MINTPNISTLLNSTKRVLKHHNEVAIARGEHFNLFSVLKIESRENNTHSAFISELLNPNGTHLLGNVFLKLFLEVIASNTQNDNESLLQRFINKNKCKVSTEFSIGSRSDETKEGGRIDIYIKNEKNSICIENKIYASDQNAQIERYYNHNIGNNTVLYLTLFGTEPIKESKGKLEAGIHYYNISYKQDIVKWLELCLKEVPNFPGLRESINQYILLIKKLTHTLNAEQQQELNNLIFENLEAGEYIANNYHNVLNEVREQFRLAICEQLKSKLDANKYEVNIGDAINKQYSQLWVDIKNHKQAQFRFGVETFSGKSISHGNMFVGILDKKGKGSQFPSLEGYNELSEWWPHFMYLHLKENKTFNLGEEAIIKTIQNPKSEKFKTFVIDISNQIIKFIEDHEAHVFKYL